MRTSTASRSPVVAGSALPPAVLTGNTGFLLGRVHELAGDRFEQALARLGLKARHYGVLAALADQGPVAQNAVGDRLRVDRSAVVSVIDELEAAGRVPRRRNPPDRGAYQLELHDALTALLRHPAP